MPGGGPGWLGRMVAASNSGGRSKRELMTIQETARDILNEVGKPMSSRALAKKALERRVVTSTARDPALDIFCDLE